AADAPLLGRGSRPRSAGARARRRAAIPDRAPRAAGRALRIGWSHAGARPRDRRSDGLQGLRRLLGAVPRRPGPGARILHVAHRGTTLRAPRADPIDDADATGRQHSSDRPRLGGPRPDRVGGDPSVVMGDLVVEVDVAVVGGGPGGYSA